MQNKTIIDESSESLKNFLEAKANLESTFEELSKFVAESSELLGKIKETLHKENVNVPPRVNTKNTTKSTVKTRKKTAVKQLGENKNDKIKEEPELENIDDNFIEDDGTINF